MIAATLAAKVGLILSVLSCGDGSVPSAECAPDQLGVYDQQTWVGPTEPDMLECLRLAEILIQSGGRAKCEVVPADVIIPVSLDYKPAAIKLAF